MLFLMRFKDVNTNILPMSAIIKKKKKYDSGKWRKTNFIAWIFSGLLDY